MSISLSRHKDHFRVGVVERGRCLVSSRIFQPLTRAATNGLPATRISRRMISFMASASSNASKPVSRMARIICRSKPKRSPLQSCVKRAVASSNSSRDNSAEEGEDDCDDIESQSEIEAAKESAKMDPLSLSLLDLSAAFDKRNGRNSEKPLIRVPFELIDSETVAKSKISEGVRSRCHFALIDDSSDEAHISSFGKLHVLTESVMLPDSGAQWHSHQNMDVITYVVSGQMFHEDDTHLRLQRSIAFAKSEDALRQMKIKPNTQLLTRGDVHCINATNDLEPKRMNGGSIGHREWNASKTEKRCRMAHFWIEPHSLDSEQPSIYQVSRSVEVCDDCESGSRVPAYNELRHIVSGGLNREELNAANDKEATDKLDAAKMQRNSRVFEDLDTVRVTADGVDIHVCELLSPPLSSVVSSIGSAIRVPFDIAANKQAYVLCLDGEVSIEAQNEEMQELIESCRIQSAEDGYESDADSSEDSDLLEELKSTDAVVKVARSSRDIVLSMIEKSLVPSKSQPSAKGLATIKVLQSDIDADGIGSIVEPEEVCSEMLVTPELIWAETGDGIDEGFLHSAQSGAEQFDFAFDGCDATDSLVLKEGDAVKLWGMASLQMAPALTKSTAEHRLDQVSAHVLIVTVPKDYSTLPSPKAHSLSLLSSIKFW